MKRTVIAVFIFAAAAVLGGALSLSCRGGGSAPVDSLAPAKVVESFYTACKNHNYDLAKSCLSPASITYFTTQEQRNPNRSFRAFVDSCSNNLNTADFVSLRAENERITNNTALVDTAFVYKSGQPEFIPHHLVRDDSWHIDMVSTLDQVSTEPPRYEYTQQLSNSGVWLNHPRYGNVWRPTEVGYDWQPYCNDGRFVRTQEGWSWNSDREWGNRVFHYGRWTQAGPWGWVWVPDDQYSPAWVTWRSNDRYVGWAPLGPGVTVESVNQSYVPPSTSWVFVPTRNFVETVNYTQTTQRVSYTQYRAPINEYPSIIQASTPFFGLRIIKGRYVNEGIDTAYLERYSGIPIRTYESRTVIVNRPVQIVQPPPRIVGGYGVPPGHGGIPPGHGGIPPGQAKKYGYGVPPGHRYISPDGRYYEKEEKFERRREKEFEKEEKRHWKDEEKEWKHGGGHGNGHGNGHGHGRGHGD